MRPSLEENVEKITRRRLCGTLLALPAAFAAPSARAAIDYNHWIGWLDLTNGLISARATAKPVFLLVHAEWCPACRSYSKLFHRPAIVDKLRAFVPVLLDYDLDPATERRYRPDGKYIPRSLLLSPEGNHFEDIVGPHKSKYFLPPSDEDYLLDYLDRGLVRHGGIAGPRQGAVRRAAPNYGGQLPSFKRPDSRLPDGGSGGPKRLRAPGTSQRSSEDSVAKVEPEPMDTPDQSNQPGLLERILRYLF